MDSSEEAKPSTVIHLPKKGYDMAFILFQDDYTLSSLLTLSNANFDQNIKL